MVDRIRGGDRFSWVMTGKTAVERIGSAVVATYVQIGSKEPRGVVRGKLTPEMIADLAEFPGKSKDFVSGSGVGRLPWKSAFNLWRCRGWKRLPERQLYGEMGLVRLIYLIPSLNLRR